MTRLRMWAGLLGVLAASFFAQEASAQLRGPLCGYVFDPLSQAIRPILGVPGAAYLGAPVFSNLELAAVAPNGRRALVVQDGHLSILPDLTAPAGNPLEDAIDHPEKIVWSPDSSAAVLYSPSTQRMQRARDLAQSPVFDPLIDLSFPPDAVLTFAVDNAGRIAVGVSGPEEEGGVYLFPGDGQRVKIAGVSDPSALAFAGGALYIADRQTQGILQIPDLAGAGAVTFLTGQDGVGDIDAIAASPDLQFLYLASRKDKMLRVYAVLSQSLTEEIPLDVEPFLIEALSRPGLYILNARRKATDPLLLLQSGSPNTTYFVPVGSEE